MDLGAIILDPFDLRHLTALQEAVEQTCREYGVPPEQTRVGYSAHAELGPRIVVHVHMGDENTARDPFLFMAEHDGFGASLSGFLGDKLGDAVPTSRAWSVSREHRTDSCSVAEGFYYTAESVDSASDNSPLVRLASKLGAAPDVLVRLLEDPVTHWLAVTAAPPQQAVAELQSRLERAPLPAAPSRTESSVTCSFYLQQAACREAQALAKRLEISLGELIAAAWETSKAEVYGATPVYDENFDEAPALPAPDARPIAALEIPSSAAPLADPPGAGADKVLLKLALSPRIVEEVQVLARAADRPLSWVMDQAYRAARARLHAARRKAP